MNAALHKLRNQNLQLPITHQRIPSNKREMQGLDFVDNAKNPLHQRLPFEILQVAQRDAVVTQMSAVVRVTTRTAQRTFLRYFQ